MRRNQQRLYDDKEGAMWLVEANMTSRVRQVSVTKQPNQESITRRRTVTDIQRCWSSIWQTGDTMYLRLIFRHSFVSLKERTIIKLHQKRCNIDLNTFTTQWRHDKITSFKDRVESDPWITTLSWLVDQARNSDVEGLICTVGDVQGGPKNWHNFCMP